MLLFSASSARAGADDGRERWHKVDQAGPTGDLTRKRRSQDVADGAGSSGSNLV